MNAPFVVVGSNLAAKVLVAGYGRNYRTATTDWPTQKANSATTTSRTIPRFSEVREFITSHVVVNS